MARPPGETTLIDYLSARPLSRTGPGGSAGKTTVPESGGYDPQLVNGYTGPAARPARSRISHLQHSNTP
jgi:hypothetical protein